MRLQSRHLFPTIWQRALMALVFAQLVISFLLYREMSRHLLQAERQHLKSHLQVVEAELDMKRLASRDSVFLKKFVDQVAQRYQTRVTIIDPAGRVLVDSELPLTLTARAENHLNRPEIQQAIRTGWGWHRRLSATVHQSLLYVARAISWNGQHQGFLRMAASMENVSGQLRAFRQFLFFANGLLLGIFLLLLVVFSLRLKRSWEKFYAGVHALEHGESFPVMPESGIEEWRYFQRVLQKLSQQVESTSKALQEEHRDLNLMLDAISEGLLAINPDQKIHYINKNARRLLDIPAGSINGRLYYDVIRYPELLSLIDAFFEKRLFLRDEIELPDGGHLEVAISPVSIENQTGCILVLRNITPLRRLEKIRRDFVANVSHEFKNPLASIQAAAESLKEWALKDPQKAPRYIRKILSQVAHLQNLVTDLLHLARVEQIEQIELVPVDPLPVLDKVVETYGEMAHRKNITLTTDWPEQPFHILGDVQMLQTILANLLDNAIKYTPAGGTVTMRVSIDPQKRRAIFSVLDTGIGIPKKYQQRIFERFFRVEKARSREEGSTGLGLSIVRHMARIQNADVGVESEEGKGSHFWVAFQLASHPQSTNSLKN